jgi:hypothetical protein
VIDTDVAPFTMRRSMATPSAKKFSPQNTEVRWEKINYLKSAGNLAKTGNK